MKYGAALAAMLAFSAPAVASDLAYQHFPDGYGYMNEITIKRLEKAVKDKNHSVVREHGWRLWAGIMNDMHEQEIEINKEKIKVKDWPLWMTWPTTNTAFHNNLISADENMLANVKGAGRSLIARNLAHASREPIKGLNFPPINVKDVPYYEVPKEVKAKYPKATSLCGDNNICNGKFFLFNGDIMIPTESLSAEGFYWIKFNKLYSTNQLDYMKENKIPVEAPQKHVVTKHMYWPVRDSSDGNMTIIPVWNDDFSKEYPDYAGYEKWAKFVAVDTTGKYKSGTKIKTTAYFGSTFFNVYNEADPQTRKSLTKKDVEATVFSIKDFYHHKMTEDDFKMFSEADKAILDAASYWADNKPLKTGDYLVTVAMHINTKEIPTWALQSVWWTDKPNDKSNPYAADRPKLMPTTHHAWKHYLLVDSYGIPSKEGLNQQNVEMNPYIELVIHPVATNCNNCHTRAAYPSHSADPQTVLSSYASPKCPDPLALKIDPQCFAGLLMTDFQWTIPDYAKPLVK